jgi:hypothetical protein
MSSGCQRIRAARLKTRALNAGEADFASFILYFSFFIAFWAVAKMRTR